MPAMGPDPESPTGILVDVSDTQGHLRVEAATLRAWAAAVLRAEGVDRASVSIALVDDAAIAALNERHLGHEGATDVISFPLSGPGEVLVGEIVVSAQWAEATAAALGVSPLAELALYVVHGLLHLCGFDDREPSEARRMHARQVEHLARLGIDHATAAIDGHHPRGAGRGGVPCPA
jgi:probable rRNA maturation factor